jgi:hypothetical protein
MTSGYAAGHSVSHSASTQAFIVLNKFSAFEAKMSSSELMFADDKGGVWGGDREENCRKREGSSERMVQRWVRKVRE